jgi:hypothetical protein
MSAEARVSLTPADFSHQLLSALDASEGRSKRRKRDQTPDSIGLGIKRALLARAAEENPPADAFEAWLMVQALGQASHGGVRAVCLEILDEFRLAGADPTFQQWLEAGAPSADADGS